MNMISRSNNKAYLFPALAVVFFISSLWFHVHSKKPNIIVSKQSSALNLNPYFIKLFSLGNSRIISDMIWIQTLLEADLERYHAKDLNNWLFIRFSTIATLDQKFYENYLYGGMFLSIIKDDLEGAADLYDKGLKEFPSDYKLNYQAGFNAYVEMGDYERGLIYLKKIENHPDANRMIKYIVQKLQFETSRDFEVIILFLETTILEAKSPDIEAKLRKDLFSIKTERDLECLNKGLKNCLTKNPDNQSYVFEKGKWESPVPYNPYRIHRRSFLRPQVKKK